MKLVTLSPGDKISDTVQEITPAYATLLKQRGFRGVVRYVTSVRPSELDALFAQGLVIGFVSYANALNPAADVAALKALGTPQGHHLFADLEACDKAWGSVAWQVAAERNWCDEIQKSGIIPARYAGAGQRLTGHEQWQLEYRLYWHSCSNVIDRFGNESIPDCGYAMTQDRKFNQELAPGYVVDVNEVTGDKNGRLPILVGA